jgi:hypothetical protein
MDGIKAIMTRIHKLTFAPSLELLSKMNIEMCIKIIILKLHNITDYHKASNIQLSKDIPILVP